MKFTHKANIKSNEMKHARPVNHWLCFTALLLIWVIPMMVLPATVEANEISFQIGVNGYAATVDTYIMQAEPAVEHGALESVEWDTDDPPTTSQYKYALIRFDNIFGSALDQIPVGAVIQSAVLTYTVWNSGNQANVHEATVGWSEDVTWDDFGSDTGVQADEYGNFVATAPGDSTGAYSIDVTASLSAWAVDPSANRGWIFRPTSPDGVDIWSSESASVGNRPKLVVNYDDTVTLPPNPPVLNGPDDDTTDVTTSPVLDVSVSDPEVEDITVTFLGRELSASTAESFSIIVLPDTQFYSQSYPAIFTAQTQWIVDNETAENIVFVTHLGDIVQTANSEAEWINADSSMDLLDLGGISYSVGPGNHDLPIYSSPSYYNTYFGISRFTGKSWYGGYYGSDNYNNYSIFSASGMDFILINLQYNPTTAMLNWADALLKANADRLGVVISHSILNINDTFTLEGTTIFNALKDNPNLSLMLCGHMHSSSDGAAQRTETGDHGNTIYVLMADYQDYPSGGNGYLRIMRFSPANNKIYVETYSPSLLWNLIDADNQFELDYDMSGIFQEIGENTAVASGSDTTMDWLGLKPFTEYEWYVSVNDGIRTTTGPVWSFTTGGFTGDLDRDCDVDGSDLAVFAADFGRTDCGTGLPCEGDFEPDGDVDGSDLALFAADFGRTDCP